MIKHFDRFTAFLKRLDLIGLVIIISVYHYYQALIAHDPFLVAAPIALFVDLLHYRSVEMAVRAHWSWWLAAMTTTALTYALQLSFYSGGFEAVTFEAMLYASIVPFGVLLWAMMSEAQHRNTYESWRERVIKIADAAVKRAESRLNEAESALNETEARLNASEQKRTELNEKLAEVNTELDNLKAGTSAMSAVAYDVMRYVLPGSETAAAIAERHGVSPATVSGIKSKMNGSK